MSHFLHYLQHLWSDPISAREEFEAFIFLGMPLIVLIVIGFALWSALWERYTGETDE